MIGLTNVVALEGAAEGVKCNIILPGAVTRMAEGRDTSAYPPMGPELVAPVVGWLAHESCSITGEMLISIAGRVAQGLRGGNTRGVPAARGLSKRWRSRWMRSATERDPLDPSRRSQRPCRPHRYSFEMATGR